MAEKNILPLFPILAFIIGVVTKGFEMMHTVNMRGEMIGLFSVFALSVLMLAFYFIYLK